MRRIVLQHSEHRPHLLAGIAFFVTVGPIICVALALGCAATIASTTSTRTEVPGSCFSAPLWPDAGLPQPTASPDGAVAADALPSPALGLRGSLDKEVIRAEIRRHLDEVRNCYERRLVRNGSLRGRVSVVFKIASNGQVVASQIQSSTMGDGEVEECVGRAVCGWHFPDPEGGGVVVVSYPFNFTSGR